jgi:hypothetical protein
MIRRYVTHSAALLALALPLAACEDVTSPSADGQTVVVLRQGSSASASLSPSYSAALESALSSAMAGPVSLSDVQSIDITVTRVEALPAGAESDEDDEDEEEGQWVALDVTAETKINLLNLPTAESGLQLARGELAPGTYGNLRIQYSAATITFARDVTVGGGPMAKTFRAGEAYPLEIGGGKIRIPTASFTVAADAGETVVITFDANASVNKVIATPAGIRMTPVLTARERDDDEDDD